MLMVMNKKNEIKKAIKEKSEKHFILFGRCRCCSDRLVPRVMVLRNLYSSRRKMKWKRSQPSGGDID